MNIAVRFCNKGNFPHTMARYKSFKNIVKKYMNNYPKIILMADIACQYATFRIEVAHSRNVGVGFVRELVKSLGDTVGRDEFNPSIFAKDFYDLVHCVQIPCKKIGNTVYMDYDLQRDAPKLKEAKLYCNLIA